MTIYLVILDFLIDYIVTSGNIIIKINLYNY